jgi:hypothetical protein
MPSAETVPDHKHAFKDALANLGFSVPRYRPVDRITSCSPFPISLVAASFVAAALFYAASATGSL